MVNFIFGKPSTRVNQPVNTAGPAPAMRIQTSLNGKSIPIGWGRYRIAGNLGWYGDFLAIAQQTSVDSGSGGGGGKGLGGGSNGGGGYGTSSQVTYIYQTAVMILVGEGLITDVPTLWNNKTPQTPGSLGMSAFGGSYAQTAWAYMVSLHPTEALNYRGLSYLAAGPMQLGDSPELPNLSFEILSAINTGIAGLPDALPSTVIIDFLTNAYYGVPGFPAGAVSALTTYGTYTAATGMVVSPVLTDQRSAVEFIASLLLATNSEAVWSSGILTVVPYGDETITANGATYTPPSAPEYSVGDEQFIYESGDDPVRVDRKRPATQLNAIRAAYLNRSADYNPAVVEAKDDAAIALYGLRTSDVMQWDFFCYGPAASQAVQLRLGREQIRNVYTFTLDASYILLDPMDIIAITDAGLGLDEQWVRIREITENEDYTLTIEAEEYLTGTGAAPLYGDQPNSGFIPDYNAAPPEPNSPVAFEPAYSLANELAVWVVVSGPAGWGGCDVYLSYDDATYQLLGRINTPGRVGVLADTLPSVTEATTGQTIDEENILDANLAISRGELLSGTQADAVALNTLCYVGGEMIAYQTATLTDTNRYDLTYLVRGAYGSTIASHVVGEAFARLDRGVVRVPFTQDRIGQTIYIKLLSFNFYGGGLRTLDEVTPFAYTILGTALALPLPDVENFRSAYVASVTNLTWDEVEDFRPVLYEIRKGLSWEGGQVLGRYAHPPFPSLGDGTYWVAAYSQPTEGLQVYSENPVAIVITGSVITTNVIATWNEAATGWLGTCSGDASVSGANIVLNANGDILSATDVFNVTDVITYGGFAGATGIYEIPTAHQIDVGRVVPCQIVITWQSQGVSVNADILGTPDFLGITDFFDYAASANILVYPEIALSQDGVVWGDWQKFTAGQYIAKKFKARMQLASFDVQTYAVLSQFTFSIDVPDRNDHYTNQALLAAGSTITFTPDGSVTPTPFNGGPASAVVPAIQVTILGATAGDDVLVTSISLSSVALRVMNAGSGVARNVNVLAQGY